MNESRSGNRHLRADPEGRVHGVRPGHKSVLVRAESRFAETAAGQHLLQMVVNLLARQYGVVDEVIVDVPPAPAHAGVFLLHPMGGNLLEELVHLSSIVGGPEIEVREGKGSKLQGVPNEGVRANVLVGPLDPRRESDFTVTTIGDGWRFQCGTECFAKPVPGVSANPIGPYMAACFAAGAVFNYFHGLACTFDLAHGLWGNVQAEWSELPVGEEPHGILIPNTYVIGVGAVGAATSFTLAAVPGLSGQLVPLDPQKADDTNRNRLLSAAYDDVGKQKAQLAAALFLPSGIKAYPYVGCWPEYTVDPSRETPANIQAEERNDRFEWVLSCVDRNIHRRNIAVYLPRHVIGGSTNGWHAQVAYYSLIGPCECLGCDHPVILSAPTEDMRMSLLRMSEQERANWYERHDADARTIQAIEEYLKDAECGTVGAAELARLGRHGETDWAVGFVSVSAGVLQAAWLLQAVMLSPRALLEKGSEVHAWFARPGIDRSFAQRKDICDICAAEDRQLRFRGLWNADVSGPNAPGR